MPEVGSQLQTYFDEVVERMTEEDVYIRARTNHGVPLPTSRFRPRPFAAAVMGFGVALVLVGVVLVMDRVLGTAATDAVGNSGTSNTAADQGSPWSFVPIIFGLGLLATGIVAGRGRGAVSQGGKNMQTIDRVDSTEVVDDQMRKLRRRSWWLGWLAGILALAVIGLGAWAIFGDSDSTADLTPAQEQMVETLDASLVAWNSGDGAAAEALMPPSGYHDNGTMKYYANGELAGLIDWAHSTGFSVSSSDRVFIGDFVIGTNHIPADSTDVRLSIFKMSPDGTQILWHFTPNP